ncbi:Uncharacterised protein [Vibrio cholerae]|nr:Uncharacterised protein [Vibrio cholerae]
MISNAHWFNPNIHIFSFNDRVFIFNDIDGDPILAEQLFNRISNSRKHWMLSVIGNRKFFGFWR